MKWTTITTATLEIATLELAYRALDDAKTEIEEFEKTAEWYTASQKMMDRIDKAMRELEEVLHQ